MPQFKRSDTFIHYQDLGKGPCIAFLHGSGGNHLSWWQQIPELSKTFRCLVLDLRGYGLSYVSTPPMDPSIYGDDLLALMDHLNIPRAHMIGQSVGGHYALRFALRYPDRAHGLVLADTLAGIDDSLVATAKKCAGPPPSSLIDRALGRQFQNEFPHMTFLYQSIEQINHVDRHSQPLFPADVGASTLATLRAPTLLIVGEHDPAAPAPAVEIAATMIEGAKFKMIPDSGHSAYFEQPHLFNQAILEFLTPLT